MCTDTHLPQVNKRQEESENLPVLGKMTHLSCWFWSVLLWGWVWAGHTGVNMVEDTKTITPLWHICLTRVATETEVWDSCAFPTRTKEGDKGKVIQETLPQMKVTTECKKETGDHLQFSLSLFTIEWKWEREDSEKLVPAKSESPVFFSDVHRTHTLFTILRVFGDGLKEAWLTSTVIIKRLREQSL